MGHPRLPMSRCRDNAMPSRRLRMNQPGRFRPCWTVPAEAGQLDMGGAAIDIPEQSPSGRPMPRCEGWILRKNDRGRWHRRLPGIMAGLVPAIHALSAEKQGVDARPPATPKAPPGSVSVRRSLSGGGHKAGHDERAGATDRAKRRDPFCTIGHTQLPFPRAGGMPFAAARSPLQSFDSSRAGQLKTENVPATIRPPWLPAIRPSPFCAHLHHPAAFVREGVFS
jgi:hypothetical protein